VNAKISAAEFETGLGPLEPARSVR
jgi:hypothetical protein